MTHDSPTAGVPERSGFQGAALLSSIYMVLGFAWIVLTDWIVGHWFSDVRHVTYVAIAKGAGYVLCTGLLFFSFARREFQRQDRQREELRRLNAELERRVEERTVELKEINSGLEAFSSQVSHDLRDPLQAIAGFAAVLQEKYGAQLDAAGQDYARRIVAAADRMGQLITDLLAYSRVSHDQIELQSIDLDRLLAELLHQMAPEIAALRAQVSVAPALPAVRAHERALRQVLTNLLNNAFKFTAPGVPPEVAIRTERRADRVRIWVCDRGIGIAPEFQPKLSQVFVRLHGTDRYPGTGLGLAIVRKSLDRMNGCWGVESTPGRGSSFWVELPAA